MPISKNKTESEGFLPEDRYSMQVDIKETLRNFKVNEEWVIPYHRINYPHLYNTASRLKDEGLLFTITIKGETYGARVRRVR